MSANPQQSIDTYFDSPSGAEILHDELQHEDYETEDLLDSGDYEQANEGTTVLSEYADNVQAVDAAPAMPIRYGDPFVMEEGPPSEQDQEALFRHLMKNHQRRLYRFVIRYIDHPDDAADITQQAFVEAARTIASFRGDSKLSTWLYGIAMNMVRNYVRKLIEQDLYELPVLSYQELTQEINIQPLARVEL